MDRLRPDIGADPPEAELTETLRWRVRLLDVLLRTAFVLGAVVAVPSVAVSIAHSVWLVAVVDAVALLSVGVLAFRSAISYRVRAIGFLAVIYGLGGFLFAVIGPVAAMYLMAVPVLAAILLGTRPAVLALAANALGLVGLGLAPWFEPEMGYGGTDTAISWLIVTLNFMFANAILTLSCAAILARLEGSLRWSKRLSVAVEQSPDGIVIAEPDGTIVYANSAATELFGDARLRSGTRLFDVFAGAHPPPPDDLADEDWRATMEVEPVGGEATRLLALTVSQTHAHPGNHAQLVAIVRDITAERTLQEQLGRSEKLQALGTLVGGTAHDFNNALTPIVGISQVLRSELTQPEHIAMIDDILLASDRANGVVRQLTQFGKHRSSRQAEVDLGEVLDRTMPLFRASVPAQLDLILDAEPGVTAAIDGVEVHQMVANLVSNAAHAMHDAPSGTITIRVRAAAGTVPGDAPTGGSKEMAQLSVLDQGHGIEPSVLPRVFDPFFTTKAPEVGTGLGLASVHGTVTALGGHVRVDSEVGEGTAVHLYLPRSPGSPAPAVESDGPRARPAPGGTPTSVGAPRARHVLLVDDEPAVVSSVTALLERQGIRVTATTDPAHALELLASGADLDVVLSDVSMATMNGIELARHIRRDHGTIPVVLMSGYGDSVRPEDRTELGLDLMLDKPFTVEALIATLARAHHGS